jgi:hypothetical protein
VLAFALSFALMLQGGEKTAYAAPALPVIEVSTGAELDAAIRDASSMTVISLQSDIDAISSATFASGRKVIIEGNGHVLSGSGPSAANNTNTALRFARGANEVTIKNLTLKDLSSNLRYGGGAVGVFQGTLTIENCAFIDNSNTVAAGTSLNNGGGAVLLHNAGGRLTITNSTFFGNWTNLSGGAISSRGPATINNCTIVENSAVFAGGGIAAGNASLITLSNSIVVNNEVIGGTIGNNSYPAFASDVKNLIDGGYNLLGTIEAVSATDTTPSVTLGATSALGNTRVGLRLASAPADNGSSGASRGSARTLAITNAASAAIGAADPATAEYTDQRGYLRDSAPDVGAYEYASEGTAGILAALQDLVSEALVTDVSSYTVWAQNELAAALEQAQEVLASQTPVTLETTYDVAWALALALDQLSDNQSAVGACADVLAALLTSNDYNVVTTDYTADSYAAFAAAKQQVADIVAAPTLYTIDEAEAAFEALVSARLSLVYTASLTNLISYAQAEIATGNYVSASVTYVTEFINAAQALLDSGSATQAQIQAASDDLLTALAEYFYEKGDKTGLISLINLVTAQNTSLYTPESADALAAALDAANLVLADDDALNGDVEEAYDALLEAVSSLVLKADKAALGSAIVKANQILADPSRYVASSLVDLNAALPSAVAAYDDANASQAVVNAQVSALDAALAKVRIVANKSKLQALYDLLSSIQPTAYTPSSFGFFTLALNNARDVLNLDDEVVTEAQIDEATDNLQNAYDGLVKVSVDSGAIRNPELGTSTGSTTTTGSLTPAATRNATSNSSAPASNPALTTVPRDSEAASDVAAASANESAVSAPSASNTSNIMPSTPLPEPLVPLAGAEEAPAQTWLPLALSMIVLAMSVVFFALSRRRRHTE